MARGFEHNAKHLPEWYEVYSKPFPDIGSVTEKTIQFVRKWARRFFRGSVRVSSGRILTDARRSKLARRSEIRLIRRLQRFLEP